MFRVTADSLEDYLAFDPARKRDLVRLHELIRKAAPRLRRYFHRGTPAGEAGMRMKMIGYGRFRYAIKSGERIEWPVIGVALQKNDISVYVAVRKDGHPIVQAYAGKLGELRSGHNNFSFERYDDLNACELSSLLSETAQIFEQDPQNPVEYMQGVKRLHRLRCVTPGGLGARPRSGATLARGRRAAARFRPRRAGE